MVFFQDCCEAEPFSVERDEESHGDQTLLANDSQNKDVETLEKCHHKYFEGPHESHSTWLKKV